ncbi:unnamed protein product [Nippostrongylus brasiliensis]|uniref:Tail component of prophage n=1 Tax=Nippostrongylus brasiliensis TaxID=27835 RepID=A0A0N4Y9H4_NIPBR|nr:unnamed protein product [Nippostrongylus brasiliensis]
MVAIRSIIQRATDATQDAATQMQMVRRIVEDIFGGSWGVIIIRHPALVSNEIHWTIPDHNNADGSPAFCLAVVKGWQYNVFKMGSKDARDRVTVESVVKRMRQADEKPRPMRLSVQQFDRMLAKEIEQGRQRRKGRAGIDLDGIS